MRHGAADDRPAGSVRRRVLVGQAVRFLAATGLSAILSMGLPILLHELFGIPPQIAVACAFVVAYFVNFIALRYVIFSSGRSVQRDFLNFGLSSLAFRGIEYVLFLALFQLLGLNYIVALAAVLIASSITKFFWYRSIMDGSNQARAIV